MTETETGLLKKATDIVEQKDSNPQDEDHADILAHIEKISSQNRIQITPQLFSFKPLKSGIKLPIIVNGIAILLVLLGIGYSIISQTTKESSLIQKEVVLQSAEGSLLAEERKRNQENLTSKDSKIKEINESLIRLASERSNLAATLDEKVKQREILLKAQIEAAIQAEKTRLRGAGYSEEEIQKRIREFEVKKTLEFNQALALYKKQVEAEKIETEQRYREQEAQYNSQLKSAGKERETLLAEAKKRESEFEEKLRQAQLAASQAGTQNNNADEASKKAILDAQKQMEELNKAREQEKNLDSQLAGFYSILREQISNKKFNEGLATLDKVSAILRADIFNSNEQLRQKRDREFYIVEGFRQYIEREKSLPANNDFIKNAGLITNAQALNAQAQAFIKDGNSLSALVTYDALLKSLPGAFEAAGFKVKQAELVQESNAEKLKTEFQNQLVALKSSYDSAGGNSSAQIDALKSDIDNLKTDLEKANTELKKTDQSLKDEKKKSKEDQNKAKEEVKKLEKQIADQSAKLNAAIAENDRIQSQNLESQNLEASKTIAELKAKINELNEANQSLKKQLDSLSLATTKPSIAPSPKPSSSATSVTPSPSPTVDPKALLEKDAQIAKLNETIAKNESLVADYNALIKRFAQYQSEIKNLNLSNDIELEKASTAFNNFMTSAEAKKSLPNLKNSVDNSNTAAQKGVKATGSSNYSDFLNKLARQKNNADKKKLIEQEMAKSSNSNDKDFYEALYELFK